MSHFLVWLEALSLVIGVFRMAPLGLRSAAPPSFAVSPILLAHSLSFFPLVIEMDSDVYRTLGGDDLYYRSRNCRNPTRRGFGDERSLGEHPLRACVVRPRLSSYFMRR